MFRPKIGNKIRIFSGASPEKNYILLKESVINYRNNLMLRNAFYFAKYLSTFYDGGI